MLRIKVGNVQADREIGLLKQENERLLRGDTEVQTGNKRPRLYRAGFPFQGFVRLSGKALGSTKAPCAR